jgi:hypothetical protein
VVDERGGEDAGSEERPRSSPTKAMTVFGRQGSPTIAIALPFSRVDVKADDAGPLVAELAALIARLARTMSVRLTEAGKVELAAIADSAEALASTAQDPRQES